MRENPIRRQCLFLWLLLFLRIFRNEGRVIHFGGCTLVLSAPCNSTYVKFNLYSKKNINEPQFVAIEDSYDNVTASYFQPNASNKIIIHGYNADMYLRPLQSIKNEYLKSSDVNVWMVDWKDLVKGPCYATAIYNARHAGKCLAQFINRLKGTYESKDFHIIGFSLGVHVPASAAAILKPYKVPRVTGLDPAWPLMVFEPEKHKLKSDDAQFVDVVHTNALMQGALGPSGNADFYMNGGFLQPGCSNESNPLNCDHHRAPEYFAESINSKTGFWGWPCSSAIAYIRGQCPREGDGFLMGEHIRNTTSGNFIVQTESRSPYAKGKWNTTTSEEFFNLYFKELTPLVKVQTNI